MEQNYDTVTACTLRNAGGKKTQHFWQTPSLAPRNVRRILVRGVNAPLPPEAKKIFQGGQLTPFAPTCGRPCLPQNVQQVSDFSQIPSTILPGNSGLITTNTCTCPRAMGLYTQPSDSHSFLVNYMQPMLSMHRRIARKQV